MRKLISFILLVLITGLVMAQNQVSCSDWRISNPIVLPLPLFAEKPSVDGKIYDKAALLKSVETDASEFKNWTALQFGNDSLIPVVNEPDMLLQMVGFLKSDRWTKATISVTTNALFEIYLDGNKVKTQENISEKPVETEITVGTGVHEVLVKLLSTSNSLHFAAEVKALTDSANLIWGTNQKRQVTIHDILDGENVSGAKLSASGKYLLIQISGVLAGSGKTQSSFRLYDMELKRNMFALRNETFQSNWMPKSDRLSYTVSKDDVADIYIFDVKTGEETMVASGLNSPENMKWSPNEDYFLFSKKVEAEKPGDLKRIFGNDDRMPNTRDRFNLYFFDLKTKLARQLTAGSESAYLQDIKPDGSRILFSTSRMDYTVVPFSKQTLFELDPFTMKVDTIWKDKLYDGSCQYSPDGKRLLVSGGPETFGELGVKVSGDRIPNSYDTQLFLYDLKSQKAEALTRDFDPAVSNAFWAKDGSIYITAEERDYVCLYHFDLKKRDFIKINVPVEVITSMDYAANQPTAVLQGSSISTPPKLYALNLTSGKSELLMAPKEQQLEDVEFGKSEEWNFVNESGTTIYGRIYYPVGYEPTKKYPLIVYYYGGTSPTGRDFGGRYPKNIWAAEGYMIYVLQPSGATGFGQDFSALHVNGWGRDAIDDIIDGTKKFLASHPSADADNVGCIGASYGGFTTMMLQTRTDIFKTAIAHAGISDISSYWGEGYWGYSYSAGATKNSYPWNRRDVYVDNSPLFRADKFKNSILLLHGTADTNVPVGESLQFYAALKILGKDVEMVLVDGENHHILDYKKRIKWHDTIMAWFDKKLKNQPEHWNDMYPDKNL
ncbi:MAG: S9 family peptidase [Draconibacterium sp.]